MCFAMVIGVDSVAKLSSSQQQGQGNSGPGPVPAAKDAAVALAQGQTPYGTSVFASTVHVLHLGDCLLLVLQV